MKKDATRILKRHPQNPLLQVKDYPGVAQIYNPSPVMYNGQTLLLVLVQKLYSGYFWQF